MISSGMKRGLAASAVSALAIAGVPLLASTASATTGDTMSVLSQGPIRNANSEGGDVIIKSSSATIDPAKIFVTNADYSNPVAIGTHPQITSPAFNVDVKSFTLQDGDTSTGGIQKFADGFYHYDALTAVTLGTATHATFGLVEDTGAAGVDAADAKTTVDVTPTGAPASVSVTPASQTTATGIPTSAYTVTVKDAAGNVTQVTGAEGYAVTGAGFTETGALDHTTLNDGTATFTVTPTSGGTHAITVTGNGTGATAATQTANASVTSIDQATITADEFDIATGADTYDATAGFPANVQVRVDQSSVTFNVTSKDGPDSDTTPDDANKVVIFQVTSGTAGLLFNGKTSENYPVLLDGNGKGSVTITPTGIVEGAHFTFGSPSGPSGQITFTRATATTVAPTQDVYVTKVGSPTSVTVAVKDQFGNAIGSPAQVSIVRGARNGTTETARQTVDATGQATFSLPDAGTLPGTENFSINLYTDQFDATATNFGGGTINYTADGQGADYTVTGATADPTTTVITPINDGNASPGVDAAPITITGATDGTPATVTVDGGALLLSGSDTTLDKGAASKTLTLAGGNGSFEVIGTKTGVVTVTIVNGGRTKTVKLTVKQSSSPAAVIATARNVALSGPAKANAGSVATFTATVTDAFGNPVPGVPLSSLGFQVTGPANLQTSDSVTDANGKLKYNVILTDNANSTVTATLTGVANGDTPQFGKAANTVSVTNDAPGIPASVAGAAASITNVVNIAQLQAAVDAAQAKVDAAQDRVDEVNGDLTVAKTQQKVAASEVKAAKKALKQAKKKHKGVAGAKKDLAQAKGDKKVADAEVKSAQTIVTNAKARLAAAKQELADAQAALDAAKSDS